MEKTLNRQDHYDFNVYDYLDKRYLFQKSGTPEEQTSALERMGFYVDQVKNGRPIYRLNHNQFAKYLSMTIHCVQNTSGTLYTYNNNGYYEELGPWQLGKIIKHLMCQVDDSWDLTKETTALESYQRDLVKIVKDFNTTNHINLQNGMLDLHTLKLYPHSKDFFSTVKLPITYNPSAQCPRFISFIKEICCGDPELQSVIQEMVGYCLINNSKAEKAFFLYGSGKNGKSVLVKVIEQLVGSNNISSVPLDRFGDSFGISSMVNKTVNISAENELKGKINTQVFKAIVSGDTININRKYKDDLECRLSTKLIMLVNNLPSTNDITYGYFRKFMILPFHQRFEGENQDVHLFEKLQSEIDGILNWALEGLKRLQEQQYQFSHCSAIEKSMEHYAQSQNPTQEFFHDSYEKKAGGKIQRSEIYADYQSWATRNGIEVVSLQAFWSMLKITAAEPNSGIDLSDERKIKGIKYLCGYVRKNLDTTYIPEITF